MNILICTDHFPHCAEALRALLPDDLIASCPVEQIQARAADVDVLVPAMSRIDEEIIAATSARLIHQFGVGLEGVDIPAASQRGIYVANVPNVAGAGNSVSVAEHAICLMLALARRSPQAESNFHKGVLGSPMGAALYRKTVAILGVGSIGAELARRLRGFELRVLGIKRAPSETLRRELALDFLGGPNALDRVLAEADFAVLALPVTRETRGLIDATALARMKRGAFLINVGRGPLVDHDALLEALTREQIAGAGLDVFWDEPADPDDPLFRCNVIATPHTAGVTDLSYADIAKGLAANVERLRAGQAPLHCANLDAVSARAR